MKDLFRAKLKLLEDEVAERSSHKNPMYYAAVNNWRWCSVVVALLEGREPEQQVVDALLGVKQSSVPIDLTPYVKVGTNVMTILDKYRDTVPDIHDRLSDAVKKAGYVVDGFYIKDPRRS